MLPCQSREAFVTVTSYRGGIMDGYLRHPRLEGKAVRIQSLAQLILTLDALVELESCPWWRGKRAAGIGRRPSGYKSSSGSITPGRESWSGRTRTRKPCSGASWN